MEGISTEQPPVLTPPQYRGRFRTLKIPACVVSIADLKRLYRILDEKAGEALEKHLSTLQQPTNQDAAQWEQVKQQARKAFRLTTTVFGALGEQNSAASSAPLEEAQLPDVIHTITFDSFTALQTSYNVTLLNRFRLMLDFTEPPMFYGYNPWEQPTPNNSVLEVIGTDETWTTAVYETALYFFRTRKTQHGWLHSQTTFTVLNWLLGMPLAFWLVYRCDTWFANVLGPLPSTLRGGLYVYIFLLALLVFRAIIAGLRRLFPVVELEGTRSKTLRSKTLRRLLGSVLGALFLALIYDVLKALFW